MNRRLFLISMSGCISLAGCSSPNSDAEHEQSTHTTTTPTPTTTAEPSNVLSVGDSYTTSSYQTFTLSDVVLRRSVLERNIDEVRTLAPSDSQFVFVTILLGNPDSFVPNQKSFKLVYGKSSGSVSEYVATPIEMGIRISELNSSIYPPLEAASGGEVNKASLGFEVPLNTDPDYAYVEWKSDSERAQWSWNSSLLSDLANPPEFKVTDVEQPESFTCGESFGISVDVRNHGGRDGIFNAVMPIVEPEPQEQGQKSLTFSVPANGEATWDGTLHFPPLTPYSISCSSEFSHIVYELNWGTGYQNIVIDRSI